MNLEQAYFEEKFENSFRKAKGEAFQTFFEDLMSRAYGPEFMACRPWGNQGDRKNDGYLKSQKRLFQVYAPYDMEAAKAIAKIREDFDGAKVHWGEHFEKWTFVHNADDGLPPHVIKLLLDYEKENDGISLEPWCLNELREVFRIMSIEGMRSWFGVAPTEQAKANLGFKDLQVVLERISGTSRPDAMTVRSVPMGKIEANALSESVATLLKNGMAKAPLVQNFFDTWHDPDYGEQLAQAFRDKYLEQKGLIPPNQIFSSLHIWAGGERRGTPEHEMAVLAVLAYYFERCDIFEEPRVATQ